MDILTYGPTWLTILILVVFMFLSNEAGFRLALLQAPHETESSKSVASALKASIFGLVAFLLAFSFSVTSSRHDVRRRIVLDEANALGTLYLRTEFLPEPAHQKMKELLREYRKARLDYFENALVEGHMEADAELMERLLNEMWGTIVAAAKTDPQAVQTSRIVSAANTVIDLGTTRTWSTRGHLQPAVLMLLFAGVLVSTVLIGHSSGQTNHRHIGLWIAFNVLFAMVLYIMLDFDRPRRGLIQVDHSTIIELEKSFQD